MSRLMEHFKPQISQMTQMLFYLLGPVFGVLIHRDSIKGKVADFLSSYCV